MRVVVCVPLGVAVAYRVGGCTVVGVRPVWLGLCASAGGWCA